MANECGDAGTDYHFLLISGGVGRTMMLADIAWILASNGRRVLAIDWNLDAPGLAEYLYPFLPNDHQNRRGVIDLLWSTSWSLSAGGGLIPTG